MPFYDLKCSKCENEFNIKASMEQKENKLISCPNCGSNQLETIFKNVNIIKNNKGSHTCNGNCHHCPNA